MGSGDYISITMSGGAPWGFRLDGGMEQSLPLTVSQIRSQSKADRAGLHEGDEVVSINGNPCVGLTYSRVITFISSSKDTLRMLIKRSSSGINEPSTPETEDRKSDDVKAEEYAESTTLQIRSAPQTGDRGLHIPDSQDVTHCGEAKGTTGLQATEQERQEMQVHKIPPKVIETTKADLADEAPFPGGLGERRQGNMVELQLSLSRGSQKATSDPVVTLLGAEKCSPLEAGPSAQRDVADGGTASHPSQAEDSVHQITKIFQINGGKEVTVVKPAAEAGGPPFTRLEVILDLSDREKEASQTPADRGCADSREEGGQPEAPPSGVSLGISSDGTEQEEEDDEQSEKDHSRPHKHRARHARLRRSESLSEKKVKEAKSKCKSIALLLTQGPTPSSKGVLMFKKRRQRAKKYTLVSYGTGELEPEDPDDEDNEGDEGDTYEITLLGTSESELDEDFFSDPEKKPQIVTFDWDTGLLEVEKSKGGDTMESLPETKGKGALMFARRKQRMDQITAEQEETKKLGEGSGEANMAETTKQVVSHQAQHCGSTRTQSCVSKSYIEVSSSHARVQNGISGTQEATSSFQSSEVQRLSSSNRSAKPFTGVQNRAAMPFSPTRNVTSPFSDLPTPPPYSSISPLPEPLYKVSSPAAGIAQPNVWSPYESMEQIASRDERISVPAKKTGILQDAKKRSTAKPMFTFKEPPKVNPNPALLSLVQNREGKRGTGVGNESGPEEDYLSLGAEACNFMHAQAGKEKTPPPVAPKPTAKSPSAAMTPVSPVWSPPAVTSSVPPVFQSTNISQATTTVPVNIAKPALHSYQPAATIKSTYKGPQAAEIVNQMNSPKTPPTTPLGNVALAGGMGPSFEMPALQGRGAELFAKRQSRMQKFVVDSSTVQANMARSASPTPSLPSSWKYSSNVRAPPPLAYNPTHSPLYPLAASKSQPTSANSIAKNSKKKPKKTMNTLDVMKHQPYQLNASLFTFQPPSDAKGDLAPKLPAKFDSLPPLKQAQPSRPVNHAPNTYFQAASLYAQPTYQQQPSFQSNAAIPTYESSMPVGYPMFSKQESAVSSLIPAPRPKFSAKKVGGSAQERDGGHSLSLPGRRSAPANLQRVASPTYPLVFQPASDYSSKPAAAVDTSSRRVTPWEAASKSPYGLVDDAFALMNIQESIAANVVSAARRKTLPEPPMAWKNRVSYGPPSQNVYPSVGMYGRNQFGVTSPTKSIVSAPGSTLYYGSQLRYPFCSKRSITDPDIVSLDTRSEYCTSSAPDSYFNSYARAWRR